MLDIAVYWFTVNVDLLDRSGVKICIDLSFDRLEHDLESCDLNTAAGGACAGADDHEGKEQEPGN